MINNQPKVYKANIEDAPKLRSLRWKLITENPTVFGDMPEEEYSKSVKVYEDWIREYMDADGAIFLLELDKEAVGMGAIKRDGTNTPNTGYMGSFGILKSFQNNGYLSYLMSAALSHAKSHNFKIVKAITTKDNIKVQKILDKYGFSITGEGYYKGIPEYYLKLVVK